MNAHEAIREALTAAQLGEPKTFGNVTVFPLLAATPDPRDYLTLDEVLAAGEASVTEVSEAGHVPELLFENRSARPVLLLDGDELVGARQNRILNLTILVGPRRKVVIPVSCVEQGRWRWSSREFRSEQRMLFARGRAEKAAQVSRSMRDRGTRDSDQHEVWRCVAHKVNAWAGDSFTGAMSDAYVSAGAELRAYEDAFVPTQRQVGAVFAIAGRPVGVELFDSSATLRVHFRKLVASYALDALERPREGAACARAAAVAFMKRVAEARADVHRGVDEGDDVRLEGAGIVGAALVAHDRVVHLSVLEYENADVGGSGRRRSRAA